MTENTTNTLSLLPNQIDTIFYHTPCQDGLGSAWIANKFAKENELKYSLCGVTTTGKGYDDLHLDNVKDKTLLFVDYAPTDEQINYLDKYCKNYYILDHHKTNQDRLKNMTNALFRMDKSGVGLTWEYFYSNVEMPMFLQLIQDRDLWTWKLENTKNFCSGLYTYVDNCDTFEKQLSLFDEIYNNENKFNEILKFGKEKEEKRVYELEELAKTSSEKTNMYNGFKVCIVNCNYDLASDLSDILLKKYDFDFVVCWRYNETTKEYICSLRANNKVDVGEVAKSFGGGGHKNASGCVVVSHPEEIFTTK